jgi:hypothetical protein
MEKKSQDVAKTWKFKCKKLGHFVKDYEKVNQDWAQGGVVAKASVVKLGPNLILLRFKVGTNGVLCIFYSRTTHSFVSLSAVIRLGWVDKKVAKSIKVHLSQGVMTPTNDMVLGVVLECSKAKFSENFTISA